MRTNRTGTVRVAAWVVFLHVAVIGSLMFFQGCRTFFEPRRPGDDVGVILPPPGPAVQGAEIQRPVAPPLGPLPPAEGMAAQWPGATQTYEVKPGDTLGAIAAAHGVTVQQIMAMNPSIKDPNRIHVRQRIVLPAPTGTRVETGRVQAATPPAPAPTETPTLATGETLYKVKRGDSLSVIAFNHGITTRELMDRNNLTTDRINVDDELIIPVKGATPRPAQPREPAVAPPRPPVEERPRQPDREPDLPAIDAGIDDVLEVDPGRPAAEVRPPVVPPPPAVAEAALPPPVADAPGARPGARYATHVVEPNEDIYKIGMVWDVNVARIREANNLPRDAELRVGQELRIPIHGD